MKTAILFSSKYGTTQYIAEMIKNKCGQTAALVNLSVEKKPNLAAYDTVIIGCGIYAGKIRRDVRNFCVKNMETLKTKKIGLFLCCMENKSEEIDLYFKKNFPESLLTVTKQRRRFPGALVQSQKSGLFRNLFEKMQKTTAERHEPVEQWVQEFINALS